jgi:hypothetical protein
VTLAALRAPVFRDDRGGTRPADDWVVPIKTISRHDLERVSGGAGGAILGGIGQAASGVGGLMGGIGSLLGGIGQLKVAKAQANAINAGAGGAPPSGGDPGGGAPPSAAAMGPVSAPGGAPRIVNNVSIS